MRSLLIAAIAFLSLIAADPAFAACTSPTGSEGQVRYDSTTKALYFCNGTSWKSSGGVSNAFRAEASASTAMAAGYNITLILPTAIFNDGGSYNTANGQYTAPSAGLYEFSGMVHATGAVNNYVSYLAVNGAVNFWGSRFYPNSPSGVHAMSNFNGIVRLNQGDIASIGIYSDTAGTRLLVYFSGMRIGD